MTSSFNKMEAWSPCGPVPRQLGVGLFILSALAVNPNLATLFDRTDQNITDITTETIPPGTGIARFGQNLLTVVPANYFLADPALDKLNLDRNDIFMVQNFAFINLHNLTVLKLNFNLLKVIKTDMLKGLFELNHLFLDHNLVHTIEILAFSDLVQLDRCLLYHNRLKSLPESAFDPNNLPIELSVLNIKNNYLQCDCEMVWLMESDGTWVTVDSAHVTYCEGPVELAGRRWDNLTVQEMERLGKGLLPPALAVEVIKMDWSVCLCVCLFVCTLTTVVRMMGFQKIFRGKEIKLVLFICPFAVR